MSHDDHKNETLQENIQNIGRFNIQLLGKTCTHLLNINSNRAFRLNMKQIFTSLYGGVLHEEFCACLFSMEQENDCSRN